MRLPILALALTLPAAAMAQDAMMNVTYACANGDRLVARYFSLSDDSLRFVKILFPDGREYTLPQVISGSGARYTDDGELLWWIKGDEARAEVRDENGEWKELCGECRVLP